MPDQKPQALPPSPSIVFSHSVDETSPEIAEQRYPNFLELISETIYLFIDNFFKLLGVVIIPFIVLILLGIVVFILFEIAVSLSFIGPSPNYPALFIPGMVIIGLVALIFLWSQIAMLYAVNHLDEKITVFQIYIRSFGKIWSLVLVILLATFTTIGGSIFLLIPGLLIGLYSLFAINIQLIEDQTGFSALNRSRLYMSKNFWGVISRVLLFLGSNLVIIMIFAIINALQLFQLPVQIIIFIYQMVLPIIWAIFISRNFHALRWLHMGRLPEPSATSQILYWLLAIVGLICVIIIGANTMSFIKVITSQSTFSLSSYFQAISRILNK